VDEPLRAVRELTLKYMEMLAMRLAETTDLQRPARAPTRARMAALAARFPGALREIDGLELEEIRRRIRQLEAVVLGKGSVQSWMLAMDLFHRLTRGALSAKSWLRGQRRVDADLQRAYAAEAHRLPFAEDASQWTAELARVASPPGGRVTHLVYARMAREFAMTEREVKELVFGLCRRERRAPALRRQEPP
jgi:hypothetical protein